MVSTDDDTANKVSSDKEGKNKYYNINLENRFVQIKNVAKNPGIFFVQVSLTDMKKLGRCMIEV